MQYTEDARLMWHPQAGGLAQLHGEGKVAAFPAIGYDPPDESHFTSRHYWEVGELDTQVRSGWMGRYLDVAGHAGNPLQGLSLDYSLAPALATTSVPVAAVSSPSDYNFWAYGLDEPLTGPTMEQYGALGYLSSPSPALAQARVAAQNTNIIRTQVAPFGENEGKPGFTSPVAYPKNGGQFPERLAVLAAMIADEALPIKCVSLNAVGGYDTHSDEAGTLATNLGQTIESVLAFQRDLEARGIDDRVVIQLWSEFGRRPEENGSGTDHGAAGVSFLIGSRVKGQMVGEFPGLAKLDPNDNLRQHLGLPRDVRGPDRAVVRNRSRPGDPRGGHGARGTERLRHGPAADRMIGGPPARPLNAAWCGALVVLLFVLALAPRPASALPWGSAWSWPNAAPARAHTDSRAACKTRRSRHGRSAGHHKKRCRGSHKPRQGTSSTHPTTGPLPVPPGGVAEEGSTPPSVPGTPGTPGGGEGGEGGGGSPPALVHVQITAVEFHFTLSRTTVPAGKVALEFVNNGQDEHNLNVLSGEGSLEGSFATTESHGIRQQTMTLKKGTFTLFCSLPEHEAKGMHSTLTVQ